MIWRKPTGAHIAPSSSMSFRPGARGPAGGAAHPACAIGAGERSFGVTRGTATPVREPRDIEREEYFRRIEAGSGKGPPVRRAAYPPPPYEPPAAPPAEPAATRAPTFDGSPLTAFVSVYALRFMDDEDYGAGATEKTFRPESKGGYSDLPSREDPHQARDCFRTWTPSEWREFRRMYPRPPRPRPSMRR